MNPLEMIRVGVFVGNFAPVHRGHTEAATAFMEQMKLDYLFVVPQKVPSHMENDPWYNSAVRLKMCELAFGGVDGVVISDALIRGGEGADTYALLRELSRDDTRLFLLFGSDAVLDFKSDPHYADILKLAYPAYVRREDDPLITSRIVPLITELYQTHGKMFRRIVKDSVDISSTRIRALVSGGKGGDAEEYLAKEVNEYIKELGLYNDVK